MNTRIRTATLLACIATGAAVLLAEIPTNAREPVGAGVSTTATETMMLALPFEGGHGRFVDTGKKGLGPGDQFLVVGMPILDNATGEQLGTTDAVEMMMLPRRHHGTVTMQYTLRLPGGHIDLYGVVRHSDKPFRIPVTGGTGRYLGVGGQLTLLKEDRRRNINVMVLELVR